MQNRKEPWGMATLGERLNILINETGKTNKDVGRELGIKDSTLSGYVTGRREPTIQSLIKFAVYFDVTVDYLIGHSDIRNPYMDYLSDELRSFVFDPENVTYLELAMHIKDRTEKKGYESSKKIG